jgi:hypothetical protein
MNLVGAIASEVTLVYQIAMPDEQETVNLAVDAGFNAASEVGQRICVDVLSCGRGSSPIVKGIIGAEIVRAGNETE